MNYITTKQLFVYSVVLDVNHFILLPLYSIINFRACPSCSKLLYMAKKEIELLQKRIELLEMQLKELKTFDPGIINQRLKSIEETLYSTKDILTMKEVCQYLDISQSLLYKLTCNGEIPHFKPRGKIIFFEKKELIKWIKNNGNRGSDEIRELPSQEPNDSCDNEKENSKEEQH